jgi:hypothetical protein
MGMGFLGRSYPKYPAIAGYGRRPGGVPAAWLRPASPNPAPFLKIRVAAITRSAGCGKPGSIRLPGTPARRPAAIDLEACMIPFPTRTLGFASAAFAVIALSACDNGTGGSLDQGQINADLLELSAKVKTMSGPMPSQRDDEAGAALKRAAGECLFDGSRIDEWIDTVDGKVSISRDTSDSYTAAGKIQCTEDDVVAYTISKSYNREEKWESWIHSRMDFPPPPKDIGEILDKGGSRNRRQRRLQEVRVPAQAGRRPL